MRQPGSLVVEMAICLFEMEVFEMDALVIKTLMSCIYITIKKGNFRHLHYIILTSSLLSITLLSFFSFGILSHALFFFPPVWSGSAPPGGDMTNIVSIIGVAIVEISSPSYDDGNGCGAS